MTYKIGVDGGGSKTECILVDAAGAIVTRHLAPGSNPSIVGPEQAKLVITDALCALLGTHAVNIDETMLFMAGNRPFWQEFVAGLTGFGRVTTADDSLPVLELATDGEPGLVLHSGTGSFVAARDADTRETIPEPTRYSLTRLPEGGGLPGIERDTEVLGKGEDRIEEGSVHPAILGGGLGGSLLDSAPPHADHPPAVAV